MTSKKKTDDDFNILKTTNTQLRNQLSETLSSIQTVIDHFSDKSKRGPNIQIPLPYITEQTLNEIKYLKKYQSSILDLKAKIDLNYFCKENKKKEKEIINRTYFLNQLIQDHQSFISYIHAKSIDNTNVNESISLMNKKTSDVRGEYRKLKAESRSLFHEISQQINLIDKIKVKCNTIQESIEIKKKKSNRKMNHITPISNDIIDKDDNQNGNENRLKDIEMKMQEEQSKYRVIIKNQSLQIEKINRDIEEYHKVINEYDNKIKSNEIKEIRSKKLIRENSKNNITNNHNQLKQITRPLVRSSLSSSNIHNKPFIIKSLNVIPTNNNMAIKSVMISNKGNNISNNTNKNFQSDLVNEITHLSKYLHKYHIKMIIENEIQQTLSKKLQIRKPFDDFFSFINSNKNILVNK